MRHLRNKLSVRLALGLLLGIGTPATGVQAQDYVGDLNQQFQSVAESRRSDQTLLPALVGIQEPPEPVGTVREAMLLLSGMDGFEEAAEWARGEEQRQALEGLAEATRPRNARDGNVFAQPYGASGVSQELVQADLYTDLGDPPLLAAARFGYIEGLTDLQILANVEASRLLAEGEAAEAANVLVDLVYLGRQIADRPLSREAEYGLRMMVDATRRLRDVLYLDFSDGGTSLTQQDIRDLVNAMEFDEPGALELARLRFPSGERAAAMQLIESVYRERGGVNDQVFAQTMSRLGSVDRPLRLFSETAKWERLREKQADWFDARDEATRIYGDWASRWELDPFDPLQLRPYAFSMSDPSRFAAVRATFRDLSNLFLLRRLVRTELTGTQLSLALMGYRAFHGVFPPRITSVRPQFVKDLEEDPFNPAPEVRGVGGIPLMEYFVPVRDYVRRSRRDEPKRHAIEFFPDRSANFARDFGEETFVLYSVGPNGAKNLADRASQDPEAEIGDYVIWPPMLSIEREHLLQTDQLATDSGS